MSRTARLCLLLFAICPWLMAGCSRLSSDEAAQQAAVDYYTMLIQGRYEEFVGGYAAADSLPADYRSQLVDAVAQTMAADPMQSLCGVTATDLSRTDSTACVLLQLQFADSTKEQILLPLVLMEEGWRMQ